MKKLFLLTLLVYGCQNPTSTPCDCAINPDEQAERVSVIIDVRITAYDGPCGYVYVSGENGMLAAIPAGTRDTVLAISGDTLFAVWQRKCEYRQEQYADTIATDGLVWELP